MKKLLFFALSIFMFISCVTVSRYSGEIYPSNVTFNSPNFKYIKTVKGASNATFNINGWDEKRADGMVNEAKKNLYKQISLKENQVPTNFTLDFVRVGKPYQSGMALRRVRAVLTADIFEFSSNGVYSNSYEKPQNINQELSKGFENKEKENNINQNNNNSTLSLKNKLKIGYKAIDNYTKLRGGYEVLYYIDENYFIGKIKFKNSLGEYTVEDIKKYNEITQKWEDSQDVNSSIDLSQIIGYKN